jgi:hypothetical protein
MNPSPLQYSVAQCVRLEAEEAKDPEKIDELKWLNEIRHRVVAKIRVLPTNHYEWTETDSYSDFQNWISQDERNRQRVLTFIRMAFGIAQGRHDVLRQRPRRVQGRGQVRMSPRPSYLSHPGGLTQKCNRG